MGHKLGWAHLSPLYDAEADQSALPKPTRGRVAIGLFWDQPHPSHFEMAHSLLTHWAGGQ